MLTIGKQTRQFVHLFSKESFVWVWSDWFVTHLDKKKIQNIYCKIKK